MSALCAHYTTFWDFTHQWCPPTVAARISTVSGRTVTKQIWTLAVTINTLILLTIIFCGGVFTMTSVFCGTQTIMLYLVTITAGLHGQSWLNNVVKPTCMVLFTSRSCLRTSCNFLSSGPIVGIVLTKDQQQTAKAQRATSFIFSVSAAGRSPKVAFQKIYWKCSRLCRLPVLYLSLGTQENHLIWAGKL